MKTYWDGDTTPQIFTLALDGHVTNKIRFSFQTYPQNVYRK